MTAAPRRIRYVTGTRADFGLMASTLRAIAADPRLSLSLIVTGMHLSPRHGETVHEIEAAGLAISARIAVDLTESNGAAMAKNLAAMLAGMVDAMEKDRPDIVLLLGDRGEMMAGALAGIHLNVPVAHIHGGERSGTVDEPMRHAISKLSHLHLVATEEARERLVRMGERPEWIRVVGAPGLDGLAELATVRRADLCAAAGLRSDRPIALLVFHPVLAHEARAAEQTRTVIAALAAENIQTLALMPNSDAGNAGVRAALLAARRPGEFVVETHLPRPQYVSWLACCDVLVGNSSSGVIEAATFGTPVVNVGSRQNLRERNRNVVDVACEEGAVRRALRDALAAGRAEPGNVYGDGAAGRRIVEWLAEAPLSESLLEKCNAY